MENKNLLDEFGIIRGELEELGLFGKGSQIMLSDGRGRVAFDHEGHRISPDNFKGIDAKYAVLTSGRYSAEYSKTGRPVKASNDDMAMMFGYRVRCVDAPEGGKAAYIIKNKGFIVSGRFISELVAACILMEKMCKAELTASRIGKIRHLNPLLCRLEHIIYVKKYSKNSEEASHETAADAKPAVSKDIPDLDLRLEIIEYGQKLVENRLIQATWGNISARIDDNRFLITPSGVDYYRIRPEEIVEIRIDDGSYAEGLHPSSEKKLHRLIYQERPDIKAVIHTHSSNCQVFAACHEDLKADEIDYPCAKYSVSGSGKLAENVAAVMADHDGCIMANHGFVTGAENLGRALEKAIAADNIAGIKLGAVNAAEQTMITGGKTMKIVCICDAGAPEMLMQMMKKLPGCEISLYTEPEMMDIKHLSVVERMAEKEGAEVYEAKPELIEAVTGADAIVTHCTPVNKAMLDAAPDLKYVGCMRTGVEHINIDVCNEKGVTVFNANGRNAVAVADQTVAMMLCEMRNIARGHAAMMSGKWVKMFPNMMYSHDMKNCTVGIIGVGKIGSLVAQRLKGFGCTILGCDQFLPEDQIIARGCDEAVSKEELLKRSDFVTMHLVYKEGDPHLIGAEELAMMKETAVLVNCARSGLVDTDALIEALQQNKIGGAAIDVFDQEPLPEDHPFLKLMNVTLTPHSAGSSIDSFANSAVIMLEQFGQIFKGAVPTNKVN